MYCGNNLTPAIGIAQRRLNRAVVRPVKSPPAAGNPAQLQDIETLVVLTEPRLALHFRKVGVQIHTIRLRICC
jgi:hypothetical protein